jgi:hypothetical protein
VARDREPGCIATGRPPGYRGGAQARHQRRPAALATNCARRWGAGGLTISGGAPLNQELEQFLRGAGITVMGAGG